MVDICKKHIIVEEREGRHEARTIEEDTGVFVRKKEGRSKRLVLP